MVKEVLRSCKNFNVNVEWQAMALKVRSFSLLYYFKQACAIKFCYY